MKEWPGMRGNFPLYPGTDRKYAVFCTSPDGIKESHESVYTFQTSGFHNEEVANGYCKVLERLNDNPRRTYEVKKVVA